MSQEAEPRAPTKYLKKSRSIHSLARAGLVKNLTAFAQYFSKMGLVTDGWNGFENINCKFFV